MLWLAAWTPKEGQCIILKYFPSNNPGYHFDGYHTRYPFDNLMEVITMAFGGPWVRYDKLDLFFRSERKETCLTYNRWRQIVENPHPYLVELML